VGGGKVGLAEARTAGTTGRSFSIDGEGVLGDGVVDFGGVISGVLTSCCSINAAEH